MSMVCPQCQGSFDQRIACPTCGVRLGYRADSARMPRELVSSGSQWQQSSWGRILIGLLLAQGIYFGLRQLCEAGFLVSGDEALQGFWSTLGGLLVLQGLQALGILIGSGLAGAGQRRGAVVGCAVGMFGGIISLVLHPRWAQPLTAVSLYGQPMLQAGVGLLGGFIGSQIWRPLQPIRLELPLGENAKPLVSNKKNASLFAGRIAFGRVIVGTAIVVCGTLWAHVILDLVLDATEGKLAISTHLQLQLVTWEITALTVLIGSGLAGAGVPNSLKQGLCVGLLSAMVLVGLRLHAHPERLQMLLLIATSSLALSLGGSWFGGQLFPPVVHVHRRRRWHPLGF